MKLLCVVTGLAFRVSEDWLRLRGCWHPDRAEGSGFGQGRCFLPERIALR